ncbi:MAG: T9SS type A sorting domain-containing protein [bacterium]
MIKLLKILRLRYFLLILTASIFGVFLIVLFSLFFRENIETKNYRKYSKFDIAYFRAELEYLKTRDPQTGKIPFNIRERELEFVRTIPSRKDYELLNQIQNDGKHYIPYLQAQDWLSRGPINIAGRIKDIAFDVANEKIILAASASGGLWRSENGGDNWRKISSPNAEQSIYCIEQDRRPGKTNTWYYGTGELLSTTNRKFTTVARTVGMGNGIYKSTDNGLSWDILPSTRVFDMANLSEVFQAVWDIEIDNSIDEQDVVYAACHGGVMKSSDGGISWNLAIGDLTNKCFSTDIEINSDNSMLYSALSSMTSSGTKALKTGIYRSKNGDNWIDITPKGFPEETRVVKIESAPSNPNVVYVFTEAPVDISDPFFAFAASFHTFWKYTYNPLTDKGTWENRTDNLPFQDMNNINRALQEGFNSLGGYCFTLNIKPDNENAVFLGGTNLFSSTNGFLDTLATVLIGGYGTYLHPDQHSIEFLPSNPNVLYNGSDGGVTVTGNCVANNVTWTEKNNGLVSSQYYSVALDQTTGYNELLIGGLQDQGTAMKSNLSFNEWRQIFGGDGLSCFIGNNRSFLIVTIYENQIYGGTFVNENQVNINYNSSLVSNEIADLPCNFFTIFDVEPNNNDELYLAVKDVIYRKTNLQNSINKPSQRNSNWSRLLNSTLSSQVSITSLKLSTTPANRLYFGSDAGKVYRIDEANSGNPEKLEITGNNFPVNGYVSCISIDPEDADKLFVVFSNYNVQSIFYSTNGGASWNQQGGNLEENPDGGGAGPSIRWIEILHREDGTIYFAGTTTGLYSTKNLAGVNTVWVKESPELIGNIKVDMITARQSDGFVAIATQGNGIYSCYVDKINPVIADMNYSNIHVSNYPNPCSDNTTFQFEIPNDSYCSLKLYDVTGRMVDIISEKYYQKGKHQEVFSTRKLSQGNYYYVLESKDMRIMGKLIINN